MNFAIISARSFGDCLLSTMHCTHWDSLYKKTTIMKCYEMIKINLYVECCNASLQSWRFIKITWFRIFFVFAKLQKKHKLIIRIWKWTVFVRYLEILCTWILRKILCSIWVKLLAISSGVHWSNESETCRHTGFLTDMFRIQA